MKVTAINHINIVLTEQQLPNILDFYEHILGLTPGYRAPSTRNGAWLYAEGNRLALIHLSVIPDDGHLQGETHFHHIALTCVGVDAFIGVLKARHIPYRLEERWAPKITQLFFEDPVGIRIELSFSNEKATPSD